MGASGHRGVRVMDLMDCGGTTPQSIFARPKPDTLKTYTFVALTCERQMSEPAIGLRE